MRDAEFNKLVSSLSQVEPQQAPVGAGPRACPRACIKSVLFLGSIIVLEFPKYTTQLMNLANQNSQGTRPKVVGQMSDLIQEFDGKKI